MNSDQRALGPVEVDVRDEPELVPYGQADRGDAVGHGGAAHGQYLVIVIRKSVAAKPSSTRTGILPAHQERMRSSMASDPSP